MEASSLLTKQLVAPLKPVKGSRGSSVSFKLKTFLEIFPSMHAQILEAVI